MTLVVLVTSHIHICGDESKQAGGQEMATDLS